MSQITAAELSTASASPIAEAQAIQGETILCVAPRMWNSLWRDTQYIMSGLAQHNRVLYFEPGRDPDRPVIQEWWRRMPNFFRLRPQQISENLIIIPTPSSLPHARRYLPRFAQRAILSQIAEMNVHILARPIQQTIKALGVKDPILWLYGPYEVGLIGRFGEKLVCYYNYDEFADFAGNERVRDFLLAYDNRLSATADVVMATSRAQWERRKALNPHTYFIPNAVDFDLFHRALDDGLSLPQDMASIRHPIIGFTGWLGYNIDMELLQKIAKRFPNASLALVGPDDLPRNQGYERLRALPNVFFLGQKPRTELPAYLRAFDVALMPYVLTGHCKSAYPMKLHEYLAAGRAIVAVDLPELYPFASVVRVSKDDEEFIHNTSAALDDYSDQAIESRVAIARENTWDSRVQEIYRILKQHLPNREERQ